MIKKQLLNGKNIVEVESDLSEVEILLKKAFEGASRLKQVFTTIMDSMGMSFHSANEINIDTVKISNFNENLIISVNEFKFSMAINKQCNILIQRPQNEKCRIFFEDFKMWLTIY